MNKVLCFGELLLRMSPASDGSWLRNGLLPVYAGGSELNVAAGLAQWNIPVSFFSAVPDHYMSRGILHYLEEKKIDTSQIRFAGNRIGIYFLPPGSELKNTGVIYDRANSSFSELSAAGIDWDQALENTDWIHFSAITPALSEDSFQLCKQALAEASKRNITVSVDLNYRSKLWKYGRSPLEVMSRLASYCDLIMGNIWSANLLLGIEVDEDIHKKDAKENYTGHAEKTARSIMEKFPRCKTVANTFRFDLEGGGILYYTSLSKEGISYHSPVFRTERIVDRVGSGDCYMAGLIYGHYRRRPPQEIVDFATSAAFGKLQETGDFTTQDIEKIYARLQRHG